MAGSAEYQSQILDSQIVLAQSAESLPDCRTCPASRPRSFSIPKTRFTSQQHAPNTSRPHPISFFGLLLLLPSLQTVPGGMGTFNLKPLWKAHSSRFSPDTRAKEYFIYSSLTHPLSAFPFCQTETSWYLWKVLPLLHSKGSDSAWAMELSSHGSRYLNISLSSTLTYFTSFKRTSWICSDCWLKSCTGSGAGQELCKVYAHLCFLGFCLRVEVTGNEPQQKGFSTILHLDRCDWGNLKGFIQLLLNCKILSQYFPPSATFFYRKQTQVAEPSLKCSQTAMGEHVGDKRGVKMSRIWKMSLLAGQGTQENEGNHSSCWAEE